MQPKTAFKILGIVVLFVAIFLVFIFIKQKSNLKLLEENNQEYYDSLEVNKAKPEEAKEKLVEEVINKEIEEKYQKLEEKTDAEKLEGYTQSEVDFILNPEKTVKEELGIDVESEEKPKILTQEEVDNILNPQNNNLE